MNNDEMSNFRYDIGYYLQAWIKLIGQNL